MSIRVVIVDDSVVMRRLITRVFESAPDFEVVGTAANGRLALAKIEQLAPDVVTMDVEMPEMNGIEAVRELRRRGHRLPIIMFSTLTALGASATLDALAAGATDYVGKPANMGSVRESLAAVAEQLIPKVRGLLPPSPGPGADPDRGVRLGAQLPGPTRPGSRVHAQPAPSHGSTRHRTAHVTLRPDPRPHPIRVLVIGSSTGGPEALSTLISGLGEPLPVPVLIVQHMPALFTEQLAARLDRIGPHPVAEAADGQELRAGSIYIAPGDWHLELTSVRGVVRCALNQKPPVNFCRPAVDVLFESANDLYQGEVLAVVLTGMGSDGRGAAGQIADAGGTVVVQDQESSVVWGMPGAVATAGHAHQVVPLAEMASTITGLIRASRSAGPRPGRMTGTRGK